LQVLNLIASAPIGVEAVLSIGKPLRDLPVFLM
jgi:hypothetical protein